MDGYGLTYDVTKPVMKSIEVPMETANFFETDCSAFTFFVNYRKLNDLAKEPSRGSEDAAGYDLYAATSYDIEILPHTTVKIGTGLAMELPKGYFGAIFARSGLATKRGLRPANCVGVIDSDYRGEIIVAIHNDSDESMSIGVGERIAQLVLMPYYKMNFKEVQELDETVRGNGGFGSTGAK